MKILGSCLVRRFQGGNPRTQMRSYSEPLVSKLLKEAFIWGWDLGSTHLQQKRGPNPGHGRDRFSLFAKKYENSLIFSTGASRRRGTPLLQFWHHEVTDCSAKPPSQKFKETNQNLKGFQRDWWDRAPSVSHWFLKLFATFAKKRFHGAMEDFRDHV